MIVHPDIAALRGSRAVQRSVRRSMDEAQRQWFEMEEVRRIRADLRQYAQGSDLAKLTGLTRLVRDRSASQGFVDAFASHFTCALRQEPLGEAPFQHRRSEGFARLQLMREGAAVLSLCVYEPMAGLGEPEYARFFDCEAHEIVIAGAAQCFEHRLDGDARNIATTQRDLREGDCVSRRPRRDARHIVAGGQSLALLQLTRTSAAPAPTREYRLADRALVQLSSGDRRESEDIMALGVLGALEAREALPQMRAIGLDQSRDRDVRWEAVRQVLAMDVASGMALLGALRAPDPLAASAQSLRGQLFEAHPALRDLVEETC